MRALHLGPSVSELYVTTPCVFTVRMFLRVCKYFGAPRFVILTDMPLHKMQTVSVGRPRKEIKQ